MLRTENKIISGSRTEWDVEFCDTKSSDVLKNNQ